MQNQERLHALDAVRAFALLAGIVLHAAMSFMPGLTAFGFPGDVSQSPALQNVFFGIHIFRMTLFFFVAGFFSHLMFQRKGTAGFLADRAKRILVPLMIGWVVFGPLVMGVLYMTLAPKVAAITGAPAAPPQTAFPLSHLWFLYYLLIIYATTLASRWFISKLASKFVTLRSRVDAFVKAVVLSPSAPLFLAAPIALCLYFTPNWMMWTGVPTPDTGLTPQLPAMIGYGSAFVFGWLLHRQSELLSVWKQRWALHLIGAAILTVASWWLVNQVSNPFDVNVSIKRAFVVCYTLASWNWVLGLIGSALRFCSRESAVRRYVADASYWMYLAHLPLVFALQMVVLKWNLHWAIKFPLIVTVAVGVLLLTYQFLVRNTYIGEILNGRRYSHARPNAATTNISATTTKTVDETSNASLVIAELSGVRKCYGKNVALDGLDLQIRAGEVLAFLGPNGAGKSTAIACLLGLQNADSGLVNVLGGSPHDIAVRRQLGVMLQDVDLAPELRVGELIDLSASYYASPMSVDEVLQLTNITSIAKRPYAKLSGGQKRLVQFAIALAGRPKLLFLDEPTVGMDLSAREMLWATLRRLVKEGCSIVLTTHYLEEAEALADRVAVLVKGKIVTVGSVDEVRARVACKQVSCITTLSVETVKTWPNVVTVTRDNQRLLISASHADNVASLLMKEDPHFRELEIGRAGLAEAFTAITQEAA